MKKHSSTSISDTSVLSKLSMSIPVLLMILFFFSFSNVASAQTNTWTGTTDTTWETGTNWSLGVKPTTAHDVVIPNVTTKPTIDVAGAVCNSLSIANAAVPVGTTNTLIISFPGTLVVTGAITITGPAAGNLANPSFTTISVTDGTITAASITMTDSGNNNRDCRLVIGTGTVNITGNITMDGNANRNDITFSGSGTLNVGGIFNGINLGTIVPSSGTVNYNNAGAQTVGNYTYNNLAFSGSGTKTFAAGTTINNTFSIASGTKANLGTFSGYSAGFITLNSVGTASGFWGSTFSSAANKDDTYFDVSGSARINNTCTGPVITTQPTSITICQYTGGTFSVVTSDPTPTYQWQYSSDGGSTWANTNALPEFSGHNLVTLTLANIPYTYDNYNVKCIVTSSAGCATSTVSRNLNVTAAPVINASAPTQPTCALATGSVVLSGFNGTWTINQTGTASATIPGTGTNLTVSGLATGTYQFSITKGCTSLITSDVVINTQPITPTAGLTSDDGDNTFCAGTSVTFTGTGGTNYIFKVGAATVQSGAAATYTTTTLTNGQIVTVDVSNGSCTATSAGITNTVNALPIITTQPTSITICQYTGGTFSVVTSDPTPTYQWQYSTDSGVTWANTNSLPEFSGHNLVTLTLANIPYTYDNYKVKCIVTSSAGCATSTVSRNLNVTAAPGTPTITTITQPSCTSATGTVILGGISGVSWAINQTGTTSATIPGSGTSATISGLAPGTYQFSITKGCTSLFTSDVVINAQPTTLTAPVVGTITQPDCGVAGIVDLSGLPPTWTLTRSGTSSATTSGTGSTTTINNLGTGTYTYIVSSGTCTDSPASTSINIGAEPLVPNAPRSEITQPTCALATGSVYLDNLPLGGTVNPGGISYAGTATTISGLSPGAYSYTYSSVGVCTSKAEPVVINAQPTVQPPPIVATIIHPTCISATGSVILSGLPVGGTINPGGLTYPDTILTITGLAAGPYNFTLANIGSCPVSDPSPVVINTQPTPPASPAAPTVGTITQTACNLATGSVVLSGLPAAGSWLLTRSPGNVTTLGSGVSTTISNLPDGTYTYTVRATGSGIGLKGDYFNTSALSGTPALTRTDATVDFDWGTGVAGPGVNSDDFNVRWSGYVQPLYDEEYTFKLISDDGVRLWVNGVELINKWRDHGAKPSTGKVTLIGGVKYNILIEFYEHKIYAVCKLLWSSSSQIEQIIPSSNLFLDNDCPSGSSVDVVVGTLPLTQTLTATKATCVSTASVTVNTPVPATGISYEIKGPSPAVTTVTNATGIFTGLAAGSYDVKSTNACLSSTPATVDLAISEKTWDGSAWVPAGVPAASDNIIFAGSYNPTLTDIEACDCTVNSGTVVMRQGNFLKLGGKLTVNNPGTLTFDTNASLTQTTYTGANVGDITYKRKATATREFDYTYWSSPVASQKLLGVSPATKLDKFYYFDPTITDWVSVIPSTTTMEIGKGYIIRGVPSAPALYTASFVGVPNNGTQTINVVGGETSNLIGNPYPSAINTDVFILANTGAIDGTLYFWTHNTPIAINTPNPGSGIWAYSGDDYASYNLTGGTSVKEGNLASEWVDVNQNRKVDSGEFTDMNGNSTLDKVEWNDSNMNDELETNEWTDLNNNNVAETGEWTDINTDGIFDTGEWIDADSDKRLDLAVEEVSNRPNEKIASGQSFFTTSTVAGGTVTFTNNMRLTLGGLTLPNNNFYKTKSPKSKIISKSEKHRVWLNLTNKNGAFKQTLVGYITGATNAKENLYDGVSYDGNELIDFYSVNQENKLAIQGRALPFDENDEVPLGFRIAEAGVFTISIDETDGLLTNQDIFIEDKLTKTSTNLKMEKYTFYTTEGTFDDRFVLRYKDYNSTKTLGTTSLETIEKMVLVSVKNKQIKINSFAETIDKVIVYDLLGRQIYKKDKINSNEVSVTNLVSSNQTLFVKITLQNGKTVVEKIMY